MASGKKRRHNSQCQRTQHTLRFWKYIGEPNLNLPDNHVDFNPKTAIFKCCNCDHTEVRGVRIRHSRSPLIGDELSGGGFYFFKRREIHV